MPVGLVGRGKHLLRQWHTAADTRRFTLWAKSLHAARTTKGWGMLVEQAAEVLLALARHSPRYGHRRSRHWRSTPSTLGTVIMTGWL